MNKLSKDEIIRAAIIKGGQKLFQQYGLNKTTMEDIAKSIGKGKSTLYYYYKSKEEIYSEVIQLEIQSVFEATQKAVSEAKAVPEKLMAYALTRFKEMNNWKNLYNFIYADFSENFQLALQLRSQFNSEDIAVVKTILNDGVQQNQIRIPGEEYLDIMAQVLVSAIRGVELDLILDESTHGPEARIEVLIKVLLNGINNNT